MMEAIHKIKNRLGVFFSVLGMILVFIVIDINYAHKKRMIMNRKFIVTRFMMKS